VKHAMRVTTKFEQMRQLPLVHILSLSSTIMTASSHILILILFFLSTVDSAVK
jgi:hypothetical protein